MTIDDYVVFSLDTSKERTGWCLMKGFKVIHYGHICPPKEFKDTTYNDSTWASFLYWYMRRVRSVMAFCGSNHKLSFTVLEDLNIRFGGDSRKVLQEVQAAAKIGVVSFDKEIPLNPIHNATAKARMGVAGIKKKDFTEENKALAKEWKQKKVIKIYMIKAINEKFGLNLKYNQDDEADAIALANAMMVDIEKWLKEEE